MAIKCDVLEVFYQKDGKMVAKVSWNGKDPTIDIRKCDEEGNPFKGISLKASEIDDIIDALKEAKKSKEINVKDKRITIDLKDSLSGLTDVVGKRLK